VNTPELCGSCGAPITPATSFISEAGVLCVSCFGRWENHQQAAQNAEAAQDAVLFHKAARLAWLHGVNWAVAVILLAGWAPVPGWLSSVLIAAVFALAFAIRLRSRLAFPGALGLDTVGGLAFLVVSVSQVRDARLFLLLFPVVFGGWLGFLTWRAREVFGAASALRE
jgi:hypothetical protein